MKTEDGKLHNMILIGDGEGNEEWYCPNCGRRLLLNWGAQFEKTVLEAGDQYAMHSGYLDRPQTEQMEVLPIEETVANEQHDTSIEDAWLAPWIKWLDEVGFDSLWDSDL